MLNSQRLVGTFLNIHKNASSGILRIERGSEKRQCVLHRGLLVFAESNIASEHLVHIMVQLRIIPQEKVGAIAALMKSGKTSEEAVQELLGTKPSIMLEARREQAMAVLASTLIWENSEVRLFPGEHLVRHHLSLDLPVPDALVLAARRAASRCFSRIPLDITNGILQAADALPDGFLALPLSNTESYVYSLLRVPLKASDISSPLPEQDGKIEEILMRLALLGLIHVKDTSDLNAQVIPEAETDPVSQKLEELLLKLENADLYKTLSLTAGATQQEIQAAYHQLARKYHPDRFQASSFSPEIRRKAEQIFALINKAYTTLKDPISRADYDEKHISPASRESQGTKAGTVGKTEDQATAESLFQAGRSLLAKGEYEQALQRFKGCAWLKPENATYLHYLGVAESKFPKLRKSAEQHFLKAIELSPVNVASRLELAKLYLKVALRRKAEQQLIELLRWDPQNEEAQKLFRELKDPA